MQYFQLCLQRIVDDLVEHTTTTSIGHVAVLSVFVCIRDLLCNELFADWLQRHLCTTKHEFNGVLFQLQLVDYVYTIITKC